ncbi:hypothetical protein B0920_02175 [Massilia sp. KIM]|uniref:hypothetical protein n=1 Tax=Massilia sp. KIM TaxID=1955422 RepID=UPI00098E90D9|nr:hypothetical protein [Massilia sp. KIM]OON62306.1 hypothetical protein B0920_02175 [Massilia sp. KIM]
MTGPAKPAIGTVPVQCCRCRHKHMESERLLHEIGDGRSARVCPRCAAHAYYEIVEQAAWCWASGRIEMGDEDDLPEGAILIARGPKAYLNGTLAVLTRQGRGASEGVYLVPGVPEAQDEQARGDALAKWLKWCAGNNGHKGRHGVTFVTPNY